MYLFSSFPGINLVFLVNRIKQFSYPAVVSDLPRNKNPALAGHMEGCQCIFAGTDPYKLKVTTADQVYVCKRRVFFK
jgi:hypothetical protein